MCTRNFPQIWGDKQNRIFTEFFLGWAKNFSNSFSHFLDMFSSLHWYMPSLQSAKLSRCQSGRSKSRQNERRLTKRIKESDSIWFKIDKKEFHKKASFPCLFFKVVVCFFITIFKIFNLVAQKESSFRKFEQKTMVTLKPMIFLRVSIENVTYCKDL